ncbi:MAG: ABC transporter permease [Thiobacillus sp.]|nr:ABC transporter permease [Thiobacillus sp.]
MNSTLTPRSSWQIQKAVVFALFLRELKTRFGAYKQGYVWLLLEPILHVVLLSLAITYIRGRTMYAIDFPVFIVTGIVPFLTFKNIALKVMESVESNKGLFTFRQIKPSDTFYTRALMEGFLGLLVYAILLLGMAWAGLDTPMRDPLTIILVFFVLALGGLGLGMIFSVVVYYLPESKTILRMIFMPLYLLSGIIFPVHMIPVEYQGYLLWNPVLHAIELNRMAFFEQYHGLQEVSFVYACLAALVCLFFGLAWYRLRRYDMVSR